MHIALITTYPPGLGSLNEYAFHFVRFLREKPEVTRLTLLVDELPAGQHYPEEKGLEIIPCWRFNGVTNTTRLIRTVRGLKPDIVLFNVQFATFGSGKVAASLGLMAAPAIRRLGYPTAVLLHNIMETVNLENAGFGGNPHVERVIRLVGNAVTRMLLTADMVTVTIPRYVELLEEKYRVRNVMLAPHGSFEESPLPSLELPPGPKQIMTFGEFGTYKRVDVLIAAYSQLIAAGRTDIALVIAGSDSPNAPGYLESVQQAHAHLPNITFTGYVPESDVQRIFQEAAVVVFPYTHTTGSSGVLHQAGDYGKAVVLPNLGDLADLITEEGYAGAFFEPDDAESLASEIAGLLDDDVLRREIGMQNLIAARGLPMNDVVDWYLIHFEEILNSRKRKRGKRNTPGRASQSPGR